jgi:hypothetical protein
MHPLALEADTVRTQCADVSAAVEHVADPASIGHATRRVDRAHQLAVFVQLVDVPAHRVLVRHREDQAVAVAQRFKACHRGVEAGCIHLCGNHHGVDSALREQRIEALRRARFVQRIAEDREHPRRAGDRHSTRMFSPPSTCIVSPVENGSAPLASIATTRPTSSGSPQRFIGAMPSAII